MAIKSLLAYIPVGWVGLGVGFHVGGGVGVHVGGVGYGVGLDVVVSFYLVQTKIIHVVRGY